LALPLTLSNHKPPAIKHLPRTKYNYTSSAEKRNAENALAVFANKAVAAEYNAEFERLWNESTPVKCQDK
jgi:hypothetical protein